MKLFSIVFFSLWMSGSAFSINSETILGSFSSNVLVSSFGQVGSDYFLAGLYSGELYFKSNLLENATNKNDFEGLVAIVNGDGELVKHCVLKGDGFANPYTIYFIENFYYLIASYGSSLTYNGVELQGLNNNAGISILKLNGNFELESYSIVNGDSDVYYKSSSNFGQDVQVSIITSGNVYFNGGQAGRGDCLIDIRSGDLDLKYCLESNNGCNFNVEFDSGTKSNLLTISSTVDSSFRLSERIFNVNQGVCKLFVFGLDGPKDSIDVSFDFTKEFELVLSDYYQTSGVKYFTGYFKGEIFGDNFRVSSNGYDAFILIEKNNSVFFVLCNSGIRDFPIMIEKYAVNPTFVFNCQGDVNIGAENIYNEKFSPIWFTLDENYLLSKSFSKLKMIGNTSQVVCQGDIIAVGNQNLLMIQTNGPIKYNNIELEASSFSAYILISDLGSSSETIERKDISISYKWYDNVLMINNLGVSDYVDLYDVNGRLLSHQLVSENGDVYFRNDSLKTKEVIIVVGYDKNGTRLISEKIKKT